MFLLIRKITHEKRTRKANISNEAIRKEYKEGLIICAKNLCVPKTPSIMISITSILIITNPTYINRCKKAAIGLSNIFD